ncbi:hypothetical protein F5Y03DRAFT_249722 [Xylaria venustula]|nr:hypothetical protein F5Y03DRAFT_249722 [Xylaria venustula]
MSEDEEYSSPESSDDGSDEGSEEPESEASELNNGDSDEGLGEPKSEASELVDDGSDEGVRELKSEASELVDSKLYNSPNSNDDADEYNDDASPQNRFTVEEISDKDSAVDQEDCDYTQDSVFNGYSCFEPFDAIQDILTEIMTRCPKTKRTSKAKAGLRARHMSTQEKGNANKKQGAVNEDGMNQREDEGHKRKKQAPKKKNDGRPITQRPAHGEFLRSLNDSKKFPFGPPLANIVRLLEDVPDHKMANLPRKTKRKWKIWSEAHPEIAGSLNQSLLHCRSSHGYRFDSATSDKSRNRKKRALLEVRSLDDDCEMWGADASRANEPGAHRSAKRRRM